nr:hypothetical protein [Saccharothrix australiensis]
MAAQRPGVDGDRRGRAGRRRRRGVRGPGERKFFAPRSAATLSGSANSGPARRCERMQGTESASRRVGWAVRTDRLRETGDVPPSFRVPRPVFVTWTA